MTQLSVIYDSVVPVANGVPAPTVLRHAQWTAVDFYQRSLAWRHDDTLQTVVGTAEYDPPLVGIADATLVVEKLFSAFYAGTPLVIASEAEFRHSRPDWKTDTGPPTWAFLNATGQLRLSPIPDAIDTVDLFVAVRPTKTTESIPDELFTNHEPALVAGTLARVMSETRKEYTNLDLAALYQQEYERRLRVARIRAAGRRNRTPSEMA